MCGEGSASGDVVKDHVESRLLVLQEPPDGAVLQVLQGVRPDRPGESLGDQLLGDATPQRVEALDLPGLDGEGAQPLLRPQVHEGARTLAVLERAANVAPLGGQLAIAGNRPARGAVRHARERAPGLRVGIP